MGSKMEVTIPALLNNEIRKSEFGHLQGSCYLDQTGSALYTKSQVEAVAKDWCENLYTNPHSNSQSSKQCMEMVDQVRYRILQHFNTRETDYSVIFTSGATAALQIVAESFDFYGNCSLQNTGNSPDSCGCFSHLQETHTSVLGMRNANNIVQNGVPVKSISQTEAFNLLSNTREADSFDEKNIEVTHIKQTSQGNSLFVFPAQCNFSGFKYPLTWIEEIHKGALERGHQSKARSKWFCMLDAATHVSTNPLDLSCVQPDFVVMSFYKMWGLPTGLGALLVRNSSGHVLHKHYFGGGTIQVALSSRSVQVFRTKLYERFEDGTINFLSICALRHGLDWYKRAGLSMHAVSLYCFALACYTYNRLRLLYHSNGQAAVHIYADTQYDDPNIQGGIVNFNVLSDTGDVVGYNQVMIMANLYNIHLRTGCFCNPGACQRHLGMSEEQYYSHFENGHVCGDDMDLINGQPTGSVRVSFGPYSCQEDANRLIHMLSECFLIKPIANKVVGSSEDISENAASDNGVHLISSEQLTEIGTLTENSTSTANKCVITKVVSSKSNNKAASRRQKSVEISRICLYPIKSCGAFEVQRWPLNRRGLLYDRCWMIVTEAGVVLTQKQEPKLCLIKPAVEFEIGKLTLYFKGKPWCSVPLEPSTCDVSEASLCQSKVCRDNVRGVDCGSSVSRWLSYVLGRTNLRLLRQSDQDHRVIKTKYQEETEFSLSLSNEAQFLLVNSNSVSEISDKLSPNSDCAKLTMMDRFRCNFAVTGDCTPFEEQNWREVHIGSMKFKVEGPCGRCQMICIDQSTGVKNKEPLLALTAARQERKFGIYLTYQNYTDGKYVSVGDEVVPIT